MTTFTLIVGFAAFIAGLALVSIAAALILGGLMLIGLALLLAGGDK